MKIKSTFVLLILVLGVGAFIWFFEQHSETTREREEQALRAFRVDPDRIRDDIGDPAAPWHIYSAALVAFAHHYTEEM